MTDTTNISSDNLISLDAGSFLPEYPGFEWLQTDMQVYTFGFLMLASIVVEIVSNSSVFAFKKDVMDEETGTEVVGHEYEVQFICLDAFFEIMMGALSSLLLGYQYSLNAIRFYWLLLTIPYIY